MKGGRPVGLIPGTKPRECARILISNQGEIIMADTAE